MILSRDPRARRLDMVDIARICGADRPARKAYNAELRSWYTRGTAYEDRVRFNKIKAHVKQKAAYLFQSESVRFGAVLPPSYGEDFDEQLDGVRGDFHRYWHTTKAGLVISLGVRMSVVYPTVVWKVTPHNDEVYLWNVPDPADIGVYEPDRPFDRQEAKVHYFWVTLGQFRRLVEGHPMRDELLRAAREAAESSGGYDEPTAPTVERLMFSSVTPTMQGVISRGAGSSPSAEVDAARVCLAELWIVDDRIGAWRCVTCLAPSGEVTRVIWDRKPMLASHDPFVALTLEEMPDYTWGLSETDDMSGLQEWHEHRADQIDRLMELQLDAPIVLGGFGGLSDERAKRLRTPGGTLATSIPNPTAQRMAPQMPPEAFAELGEIGKFFAEAGGLPQLLHGQLDANMKGSNAETAAALASPQVLDNAMRVEYATSEVATLMWRMRREISDDPIKMPNGQRFLLSQIPGQLSMEVASHSSSPLLMARTDAGEMLKLGAIDRPTYIELKNPPMVDLLRARARKLEAAAAKKAERIMKLQELKAERGRSR